MKRFLLFLSLCSVLIPASRAQVHLSVSMDHLAFAHRQKKQKFQGPILRAAGWCTAYNLSAGAGLFALPSSITHWKREEFISTVGPNLKRAWTRKPVWDRDNFYINYLGHPYQGGFYYNTLRSQGVRPWKCSLFLVGQTLLWEFAFEAIKEHPSRQDLITTPLGGILIGELSHRLTRRMQRHGFNFWEKVFVTVFNPAHVLNHGYR